MPRNVDQVQKKVTEVDNYDNFEEPKFEEPVFAEDKFTSEDPYGVDNENAKESASDLSDLNFSGDVAANPEQKPVQSPDVHIKRKPSEEELKVLMGRCPLFVLNGLVTGMWFGGMVGTGLGVVDEMRNRTFRLPGIGRRVAASAWKTSKGFARFLLVYNGVLCYTTAVRQKHDSWNNFAGGFAAMTLQSAVLTRSPIAAVTSGMLGGTIFMLLEKFN